MRNRTILKAIVAICVVCVTATPVAATCFTERPPVFQCSQGDHIQAVPAPYSLDDVTVVFWQIGFGNGTVDTGGIRTFADGTGITGASTFNGNDSGTFVMHARDASLSTGGALPPGFVCVTQGNWRNDGVDGCADNPRVVQFPYGPYLMNGDDDLLNPFFNTYLASYGDPGIYTTASQTDYPVALLLKTPDEKFFAVAAVATYDWQNDGSGDDGPCAADPGTNPGPCPAPGDLDFGGHYDFGDVSNGLPNAFFPGNNNVLPWQSTPEPGIVSNTQVVPGDPNSDRIVDFSWPAATMYSDESVRPSTNPTMAPADPSAAPGVGVLDIQNKFGLIRYVLEAAAISDPGFSSPIFSIECPGDPACTSATSATATVPVDTCVRLHTLFGKKPQTSVITRANCRLGKCGDIGYGVTSDEACFTASCSPEPEVCDNLDNDCNGTIDEFPTLCGVGQCTASGTCSAGLDDCVPGSPTAEICDNLDNDCDGVKDEIPTACGVGQCASTGYCSAGSDTCAPGAPSPEICDNLDNNCDGVVDSFPTTCGVGQCASAGTCAAGLDSCTPGTPVPEQCDGLDNDCDGLTDEGAGLPSGSISITPTTLNINSQGTNFTISLDLVACDAGNLQPIDGSLLGSVYISRAGSVVLPDPASIPCPGPGGDTLFERGIADNPAARGLTNNAATLRFNVPPDGDCHTLDGDRQDLLALLSDALNGSTVPICIAGTVDGEPFEACTTATVNNHGNR